MEVEFHKSCNEIIGSHRNMYILIVMKMNPSGQCFKTHNYVLWDAVLLEGMCTRNSWHKIASRWPLETKAIQHVFCTFQNTWATWQNVAS